MNIGEKIHNIRKKNKISVSKLADIMNVSAFTISSWEKGDLIPDEAELKKLAQALNVSIETLLDKTEYYNNTDLLTNMYDDYKEKNKGKSIFLIILTIIIAFLVGDTCCAIGFKRNPLVSWKVAYLSGDSFIYKGLFMDTFYCVNDKNEATVVQKFKLSKFDCQDLEKKNDKTNKQVKDIRDTSKDMKDFKCSNATELFFEDNKNEYYLECTNSSYVIVTYTNNKKENVKVALEQGKITIKDLDEYGIKYNTVEKTDPIEEGYPKQEDIILEDSLTFYLHKDNIEAVEVTFKVEDGTLIAINEQTGEQKEIFASEEVASIAKRNYGSKDEAKIIILTTEGNLYISKTEINYSYKWDDDMVIDKTYVQNVASLRVEYTDASDLTGALIALDSDGNEFYVK